MDAERIAELRRLARHAEGSPHGGSVLLAEWLTEALGALEAARSELNALGSVDHSGCETAVFALAERVTTAEAALEAARKDASETRLRLGGRIIELEEERNAERDRSARLREALQGIAEVVDRKGMAGASDALEAARAALEETRP